MSYIPNTWVNEAAQQLGENWASYGSVEELEWISDSTVSEYLHGARRDSVVDSLNYDRSPENVALIAVEATRHAIRVIEAAGGNIGPNLPARTLLKAVEYTMEIHQAIHHPYTDIGVVLEPTRFLTKRVSHIATKMYQTRDQDHV